MGIHYSDSEIRTNIYKSLLLNSLSLTSIYTFDLLLAPLVRDQQKWLHRNVGWFYQVLWLLPVVGVSFYLNVSESDGQSRK
jgi:etoposide-induced 2.4 mRNA